MDDWESAVPMLTAEEQRDIDELGAHHDGAQTFAERQAMRWFRVALVAVLASLAMGVWHHIDKMAVVEPFVLVIEKTDDGQVTLVNPPTPMKDFIFPAEAVMGMVSRFVMDRQRLGEDKAENEERRMNVEAAVCGPAAQQILVPPQRDAAMVAVNLLTPKPTTPPQTYAVRWTETWYDRLGHSKGDHERAADVTVVRRDLDWKKRDALEIWRRQPMGLCVSSFVMHGLPTLKEAY